VFKKEKTIGQLFFLSIDFEYLKSKLKI